MKTKTAVIGSIVWFVLVLGILFAVLSYQFEHHTVPRSRFNKYAESMGQFGGVLIALGWAGLWIPWALRRRKEKLAKQAAAASKKRRSRPSSS